MPAKVNTLVSLLNKAGAYPWVEHLKGATLGYAPVLLSNIRISMKSLPRANTLASLLYKAGATLERCFTWLSSDIAYKYWTTEEKPAKDKHTSFFVSKARAHPCLEHLKGTSLG